MGSIELRKLENNPIRELVNQSRREMSKSRESLTQTDCKRDQRKQDASKTQMKRKLIAFLLYLTFFQSTHQRINAS
jgi:hypothetical protein